MLRQFSGFISLGVIIAAVVFAIAGPAGSSGAAGPMLIDSDGAWTFSKLGYPTLVMHQSDRLLGSQRVSYLLPESADQGPDRWYRGYLHFAIETEDDLPDGFLWIFAFTNGATFALLEIETFQSGGMFWKSGEVLTPGRWGFASGNAIEFTYLNLLQNRGVQPGENQLTFSLDGTGQGAENIARKVKSFTVFDDSAIIRSPLGVPKFKLNVETTKRPVRPGDEFAATLRIANEGWPASNVRVAASYPTDALRGLTPDFRALSVADTEARVTFAFKVLKDGEHVISFQVGGAQAVVLIDTTRKPFGTAYFWAYIAGMTVFLTGTIVFLVMFFPLYGPDKDKTPA